MTKIMALALNTFREAIRNKVFYIIFIFAVVMLGSSLVFTQLALGEEDRIVKDLGLAAINVFGLLLAAFVGVNLVHEELDKRTIYLLLATGMSRTQFILGKYLGLFITVLVNVLLMALLLFCAIGLTDGATVTPSLVYAIFLYLFEVMVIIAIAVLFSSFSTPVLSAVLTFMCWAIGHLSEDLLSFAERLDKEGSVVMAKFLTGLYYVLPNLELFNIKNQVVYQESIMNFVTWKYPAVSLLYTAILLSITALCFSRRDVR